jgi:hypothetical protein
MFTNWQLDEAAFKINQCNMCRKNTRSKCEHCKTAYYCCTDCQAKDIKNHRKMCAHAGGLKAKPSIGVRNCNLPSCGNPDIGGPDGGAFKLCSRCKAVCYCCRECQQADWKEHKKSCGEQPK